MSGSTQRSDARNLALHRAALTKLRAKPELRRPCLDLVNRWLQSPGIEPSQVYLERWRDLLMSTSDDDLERTVLDPEAGQALRSCSPLGPVFTPRERWAVLAREDRGEP